MWVCHDTKKHLYVYVNYIRSGHELLTIFSIILYVLIVVVVVLYAIHLEVSDTNTIVYPRSISSATKDKYPKKCIFCKQNTNYYFYSLLVYITISSTTTYIASYTANYDDISKIYYLGPDHILSL